MKTVLSGQQIQDLAQLYAIANQFGADLVIIGAIALLCFINELSRFTRDIDLVIALDLEDFSRFSEALVSHGWTRDRGREHRWRSPIGTVIDLVPAGPRLRSAKCVIWPESQFSMSLAGFEHVFTRSVPVEFASDVCFEVAPLPVVALLKIVAYLENPYGRAKDLDDLKLLFRRYEEASDRIFCDEVFAADLQDIAYANAFLLGLDVGLIATSEEAAIVHSFLARFAVEDEELDAPEDLFERERSSFRRQLRAFHQGLRPLVT